MHVVIFLTADQKEQKLQNSFYKKNTGKLIFAIVNKNVLSFKLFCAIKPECI